MNRKFRVTSLTAAALASLFLAGANLSNEVKADVNPAGTRAQAHSAVDNAKENVDSAQRDINNAQADVDSAKGALDQAQSNAQGPDSAYSEQSKKTDVAKKNAADKADKLADAKKNEQAAENLAKEATSGNIQKVKNAVKNQQDNVIPVANNAKRTADQAVSNKKQDVTNKEAAVKIAQYNVDAKQNAVKQTDHDVQIAEDALKGTGIPTARKKLDDATIAKNAAQSAFSQADTDVQAKQTAKASAVTDLSNAQTTKNNADNAQSAAQSAFDTADRAAAAANQAVKNKQNEIDQLATQLGQLQDMTKNTINLVDVDKFKQAYADYLSDNELNGEDIQWADNAIEANHFVSSDTDKKIMVDVNNITPNQMKELALFTADLLNKVKNQIVPGSGKDEVTEQAINFTKQIAQRYVTDQENGSWNSRINWHDATGINDLAKADGLVSNEKSDRDKEQPYENKDERWLPNPVSMDALKHNIYNSLREMIIPFGHGLDEPGGTPKYEMAHTAGLLGLDRPVMKDLIDERNNDAKYVADAEQDTTSQWIINGTTFSNDEVLNYYRNELAKVNAKINKLTNHNYIIGADDIQSKQYIATTYSISGGEPLDGRPHMNIHFITISPDQIKDPAKFGTTVVESYADRMDAVQQQINDKNNELNPLQIAADHANAAKKEKEVALNAAKNVAVAADNAFISAKGALTKAANALIAAKQNEQEKQTALQNATTIFNNAKHDYDVLTASNATKTANLNRAVAARTQAQTELANAKVALKNAQDNLDNAKSELTDLEKTAQMKSDEAKKAQDDLIKFQKHVFDLQNAPEILANAKTEVTKAQKDYDAAKKVADNAEKELQKLASAKSSADAQVASAQSTYEAAQAALKVAEDKLAQAKAELTRIEEAENRASSITTDSSKIVNTKAMLLNHNALIYDLKGKNTKKSSLKKGTTIQAWNNGKLVIITGHKYYQIGENEFIKAGDVARVKKVVKKTAKRIAKAVRLTHNSFVYTKSGKTIRKGLHFKFIRRGKSIKALHNGKIVVIKGHEYYQISKNEFIKVANGYVKTKAINIRGEVKGSRKVKAYDRSGKFNKHYLRAHHIYTFNEKKKINGKTYYKVKWTNNWVPVNVLKFRR